MNKKGFTLVEIIASIIILGLISGKPAWKRPAISVWIRPGCSRAERGSHLDFYEMRNLKDEMDGCIGYTRLRKVLQGAA